MTKNSIYLLVKDVVVSRKGKKPLILKNEKFDDSVPYLDINALETGIVKQFTFPQLGTLASKNDIFIVWDGSRSGLSFLGEVGIAGSTIMVLTPVGIDSEYLYYFIKYNYEYLNVNTTGSGVPHVNVELFFNLKIPYFPLETQKKLIEEYKQKVLKNRKIFNNQRNLILNVLSDSKIESIVDHDISDLIEKFRISILEKAFKGVLTEKWRSKNKISGAMLPEIGYVEDINKNIPDDWQILTINSVTNLVTDGKHGNSKDEQNSGYYFLSAKDIKNGKLVYNNARQITYNDFIETHRRTDLKAGDLCIVNTGATIGKTAIVTNNEVTSKTTFQKSVAIIKVNEDYLDVKYLNYFLIANNKSLHSQSSGTAIKNLLISDIKAMLIPIPPISEQVEIAKQLDQYFMLTSSVKQKYKSVLSDFENYEKSLLQELFTQEILGFDKIQDEEAILEALEHKKKIIKLDLKNRRNLNLKSKKNMIDEYKRKESLEQILNDVVEISTEDLWKNSVYFEDHDVEGFYQELRSFQKSGKLSINFSDDSKTVTNLAIRKDAN